MASLCTHLRLALAVAVLCAPAWAQTPDADRAGEPDPEAPAAAETWETFEAEWAAAVEAWSSSSAEARAQRIPLRDRPPHPVGDFWPRARTAAAAGDHRAVNWMLRNQRLGSPSREVRQVRSQEVMDALEQTSDHAELGVVLERLGTLWSLLDAERLDAWLTRIAKEPLGDETHFLALALRATVVEREDSDLARELRLRAARVRWESPETRDGPIVSRDHLDEIARRAADEFDEARRRFFDEAFIEAEDGTFRMREDGPSDPNALYRPLLRVLADEGSPRARIWMLSNPVMSFGAAGDELLEHARVLLADDTLDRATRRTFVQSLGRAFHQMTPERVALLDSEIEERREELTGRFDETDLRSLWLSLGTALLSGAGDHEAWRDRGRQRLEEVIERWPDSHEAGRARGALVRYLELVVGRPAPDFTGTAASGDSVTLSDLRGQVVVIKFWGFW